GIERCELKKRRNSGFGIDRGQVRRQRGGGQSDAASAEAFAQQISGTSQPPFDGSNRPAQPPGYLIVRQSLEITEQYRYAILLGQVAHLMMQATSFVEVRDGRAIPNVTPADFR